MKRIFKKNQIIIAALAVMIAAAGYLNYSGKLFGDKDTAEKTNAELANKELLDISEEDVTASASDDIKSQDGTDSDGSVDGTPGETVLTSGEASAVVAEAKVTREQVRAKNKESLMEIIDNENLSDEQKQDAVNCRKRSRRRDPSGLQRLQRGRGKPDPGCGRRSRECGRIKRCQPGADRRHHYPQDGRGGTEHRDYAGVF